ncbi:MAG: hypothetical protein HY905_13945 [Deltaproteobacteria bacterium]|nr:hypothetical protein [Deltaproteobacteria bacterium]
MKRFVPAVVLVALAAGRDVRAQDAPPYPLAPECRVEAETDVARRSLAAFWFEQGKSQVDREAFAEAVGSFACSQAILPHPSTLYNLARAAEWAGDFDTSLRALREYIAQNPDAENLAEARDLALGLQARVDARVEPPPPAPPPPSPPPPAREADAQAVVGWVAVALAAGSAAAGLVLAGLAAAEQQKIDAAADGTPWSVVAGREADRDDYLIDMGACLGAAGAAALTGILLLVLDDDETPTIDAAPTVVADGVGLVLTGRF